MSEKQSVSDIVSLMIRSINSGKIEDFYSIAERYKNQFSKEGNNYHNLHHLLLAKPKKFTPLQELKQDVKKLIIFSELKDENVFLKPKTKDMIDNLSFEFANKDIFSYHNLPVANKVLLHGSTGNGKTTIAKHIAKELDLPFVEISSDSVIEGYVGRTGANINNIFNQINEPCVLFWDEIDTIGRKRTTSDGSSASFENDRMVNSILVNIDKLSKDVVFIGATNRKDILDSAFVRRFDILHEIDSPEMRDKTQFIQNLLTFHNLPFDLLIDSSVYIKSCDSFSDLKTAILREARQFLTSSIMSEKKRITE